MAIKIVLFFIIPYVLCYQETNQNEHHETYNYIKLLLEEFKIQHPHPNIVTSSNYTDSIFLRKYFKKLHMTNVHKVANMTEISNNYPALIFVHTEFMEEHILGMLKKLKSALVIIKNEKQFDEIMNKVALQIDQKVYFIQWSTKNIFETYTVNNFYMKRQIGYIGKKAACLKHI